MGLKHILEPGTFWIRRACPYHIHSPGNPETYFRVLPSITVTPHSVGDNVQGVEAVEVHDSGCVNTDSLQRAFPCQMSPTTKEKFNVMRTLAVHYVCQVGTTTSSGFMSMVVN